MRKQLPNLCCQIFKHLLLMGEGTSLLGRIFSPGLFSSVEIISIRKNFLPEIIFIGRNHLYPQKFPVRDYFHRQKSSLFAIISCQRLFFIRRNHLYPQEFPARDYSHRQKSSLSARISCQRLFSSAEIISIRRNVLSGIISINRDHFYS